MQQVVVMMNFFAMLFSPSLYDFYFTWDFSKGGC